MTQNPTRHKALSCAQVDDLLCDYAYGRLEIALSNQVSDHLLNCPQHHREHCERFNEILLGMLTRNASETPSHT